MTDVTLQNPIVTAVQAVKNGNDIEPISSSNPLPVSQPFGVVPQFDIMQNLAYRVAYLTAAVSAKYSAFQILNPTSKDIFIHSLQVWWASGTNIASVFELNTALTNQLTSATYIAPLTVGGAASGATIYYDNLASIPATTPISEVSTPTAVKAGTNILTPSGYIKIPANKGIVIVCNTQNMAMGISSVYAEKAA